MYQDYESQRVHKLWEKFVLGNRVRLAKHEIQMCLKFLWSSRIYVLSVFDPSKNTPRENSMHFWMSKVPHLWGLHWASGLERWPIFTGNDQPKLSVHLATHLLPELQPPFQNISACLSHLSHERGDRCLHRGTGNVHDGQGGLWRVDHY